MTQQAKRENPSWEIQEFETFLRMMRDLEVGIGIGKGNSSGVEFQIIIIHRVG